MPLTIGIVDANEPTREYLRGQVRSYIGFWLKWEIEQAGLTISPPDESDLSFLAHAGAKRYGENVRRELRLFDIEPYTEKRGDAPYVITGGPVDATPFLALDYANTVTVGEAYQFVRGLLALIKQGAGIAEIQAWITEYPYAIERGQVEGLARDVSKPWLLTENPEPIAEPDPAVDWDGVPPIIADDNVVRLIASKGCPGKCLFCATTWRQPYCYNENTPHRLLAQGRQLTRRGQRVLLVTNDLAALPWFEEIDFKLDSESLSVRYLLNYGSLHSLLAGGKVGRLRFGIEGVSERLRKAIGKPIDGDGLVDLMGRLMNEYRCDTHLFYIVGLPFETGDDWEEFKDFYYRLTRTVDAMLCRIKFTTFEVAPPSPLARFATAPGYYGHMEATYDWICQNAANRHFAHIKPYKLPSLSKELADTLGIDKGLALSMLEQGNFDLCPTLEEAERMPWEVVKWPTGARKRWKMAETYRGRVSI